MPATWEEKGAPGKTGTAESTEGMPTFWQMALELKRRAWEPVSAALPNCGQRRYTAPPGNKAALFLSEKNQWQLL